MKQRIIGIQVNIPSRTSEHGHSFVDPTWYSYLTPSPSSSQFLQLKNVSKYTINHREMEKLLEENLFFHDNRNENGL